MKLLRFILWATLVALLVVTMFLVGGDFILSFIFRESIEDQKLTSGFDASHTFKYAIEDFYRENGRLPTSNQEAKMLPPDRYQYQNLATASIMSSGLLRLRFTDVHGRNFVTLNYHPAPGVGQKLGWLCRSPDFERIHDVDSNCEFSDFKLPDIISPSFDCKKAQYPVEIIICNSPELALLDWNLSKNYKNLLAYLPRLEEEHNRLIENQRGWLRDRLTICRISTRLGGTASSDYASVRCLSEQYKQRGELLEAWLASKLKH